MEDLDLVELAALMNKRLARGELDILCFNLGMNAENVMVAGEEHDRCVARLLIYCQRRESLPQLWQAIRRLRPDVENFTLKPRSFWQLFAPECEQLTIENCFNFYDELLSFLMRNAKSLFVDDPENLDNNRSYATMGLFANEYLRQKLDSMIEGEKGEKHRFYYLKSKLNFMLGELDDCRDNLRNHCLENDEIKYTELMLECLASLAFKLLDDPNLSNRELDRVKQYDMEWQDCLEKLKHQARKPTTITRFSSLRAEMKELCQQKEADLEREKINQEYREKAKSLRRDIDEKWKDFEAEAWLANKQRSINHTIRAMQECETIQKWIDDADPKVLEHYPTSNDDYNRIRHELKPLRALRRELEQEQSHVPPTA